jgi:1-acyl-sn-glycerol-3-phosphate acyltransferase
MTANEEHRIYLQKRKGFVKLALQYGVRVVPMYAFGEESAYTILSYPWLQRLQVHYLCHCSRHSYTHDCPKPAPH